MPCITKVAPSGVDDSPVVRKRFRASIGARDSSEVVARQNAISLLSFQLHDAREDALAFINDHCGALGGRPLDVAGESDVGLNAAIQYLRNRDAPPSAEE